MGWGPLRTKTGIALLRRDGFALMSFENMTGKFAGPAAARGGGVTALVHRLARKLEITSACKAGCDAMPGL